LIELVREERRSALFPHQFVEKGVDVGVETGVDVVVEVGVRRSPRAGAPQVCSDDRMSALPPVRPRALVAPATLLALFAALLAVVISSPVSAAPPDSRDLVPLSAGEGYTSLTPARLLDTRPGTATIDGQAVGGGAVEHYLDLPVRGRGGVPSSGVRAVALNVTVTAPTSASFVTVWPAGEAQPNASNLNFEPAQTVANSVIVQLGSNGAISFFNETGTTHLVVDVVGWFASDADFTSRVPARILDTRPDGHTIDGAFQGDAEPANVPIELTVTSRADVPEFASAVVLNVTIVAPTESAFATVWPHGSGIPNASNLNFEAGRNVANLVVAEVGDEGKVDINFAAGDAYVLADVVGWFGDGFDYVSVLPARLLDTRSPNATIDGGFSGAGPLHGPGQTNLQVLGRGGVPSDGVDAIVVNVTVTQPTTGGFATVWPTDGDGPPNASTLNFVPGRTVPNLAIVKVGAGGSISLFNEQGDSHFVVDVVGWFPSTFDITEQSLTPGVVGTVFSQTLGTFGVSGATDWGFVDTAPGLSGSTGGVLSGTPTVAGTYSTLAVVADSGTGVAARIFPHHIFGADNGFTPVTPTQLYSSYTGASPLAAGTTRTVTAGGVAGVPGTAEAVVVGVTASSSTTNFLTAWAAGQARPDVSSVMVPAQRVRDVLVVPLGSGQFNVFNLLSADYELEVLGYFANGSPYTTTNPMRVLDTRNSTLVAPGGDVTIGLETAFPLAKAVVLTVTTTNATAPGSLDVAPTGAAFQSPTTFDFGSGTSSQTVVVPVSDGMSPDGIHVRNRAGTASTHIVVDVVGFFTD
jgi:hypothetical protein